MERTCSSVLFLRREETGRKEKIMSNSSLVNCTVISPNKNSPRNHRIDRITPHCVVGQLSAESIGGCFTSRSRQASCNYGIGSDGRIVLVVDEKDRSWCSSSPENDHRAVTIECASDRSEPYAMNNKVYDTLVRLCADICRRNGIRRLLWLGSKEATLSYTPKNDEAVLTAHRWFANKSCPGDWLYSRYGDLAIRVNALLGSSGTATNTAAPSASADSVSSFPAVPFLVQVLISDLNYRSAPSMSGKVNGQTGKGTFTITEVRDGWGRLKSDAGWIWLKNPTYCTVKGSAAPSTSQTTAKKKSVEEVAREVIRGNWGNGADRKKRLTAAGYDYAVVQAVVNRLCR